MAQFDVHRIASGGLVIDCQSTLLDQLNTRFVVPLVAREAAPPPAQRLNPTFAVAGEDHVMLTQFAGAIERRELGEPVANLTAHARDITAALDVLLSGV